MYYNSGDRQNSLSLIAILITRLNTRAAIPYSLTCHHPHPKQRGAPPGTALLTQTPLLHTQLMFMHAAISIPPTQERQYPGSSHPKGHSWGHISPGTPGSSEEMLSSPMNTLEVPGVSSLLHQGCCGDTWSQCWRCLLRGCKQKALSFQHASPSSHPPLHRHPQARGVLS